MNPAPVALFVYKRLAHTQATVDALRANRLARATDLYVFSDFARERESLDEVATVREYVDSLSGFKSITVIRREVNHGLSRSIMSGVDHVIERHGQVIVVEDDIVTSPYFLDYMNDGLVRYASDDRVISIHGYVYPLAPAMTRPFFLRGADCWGWATWSRGWALFNPDGRRLLSELTRTGKLKEFDFNGSYDYSGMLRRQISGENDSWAVRWYASAFLENKLTLYPAQSLVRNIGVDGSGVHCESSSQFESELAQVASDLSDVQVLESPVARRAFEAYFQRTRPRFLQRLRQKMMRLRK